MPARPLLATVLTLLLNSNLVFDGGFFYQYDGLNRLAQVNDAGGLTADDFWVTDPNEPYHRGMLNNPSAPPRAARA